MMYTLNNFYTSNPWIKFMANLKHERTTEEGYIICEHCNKHIVKKYDCIGHHVIELTELNVNDYSISLNPSNIILLCFDCHNKEHRRFGYQSREVYCVYGSPCSGKSTWVEQRATKDDLIVDMDSIYECISMNDRYIKPDTLKQNAFAIKDLLIDMIKTRRGKWNNAYIIGGYPLIMERKRLHDMTNCMFVFIDETRETCLENLGKTKRTLEWSKYIDNWFEKYQENKE